VLPFARLVGFGRPTPVRRYVTPADGRLTSRRYDSRLPGKVQTVKYICDL
jgi:hypothetical protein